MGSGLSNSRLSSEELKTLESSTNFNTTQIKKLYARYLQLDKDKDGYIHQQDLYSIPELAVNPLASRIISLFAPEVYSPISFTKFLSSLSPLSPTANSAQKLQFAFAIYDVDGNQAIDDSDLTHVLQMLVGENMTSDQISELAMETLRDADMDGDGLLSLEEFSKTISKSDIEKYLVLEI